MTAGRILYLCYHHPKGALKKFIYTGGRRGKRLSEEGRLEMESAAHALAGERGPSTDGNAFPPQPLAVGDGPEKGHLFEVHTLAGRKQWFMVAFMVKSLQSQISRPVRAHIYDDGAGWEPEQKGALGSLGGEFIFHDAATMEATVHDHFPEKSFPSIRRLARQHLMMRKVLGPHAGSGSGPKLYIDSDILFFGAPLELMAWVDEPRGVLCTRDLLECYGYPRQALDRLAEAALPPLVNAGITGICTESIDWEYVERWCHELEMKFGKSYYMEQALVATLAARLGLCQLDPERYITLPSKRQIRSGAGVAQHYVDISRTHYFRTAWRRFAHSQTAFCKP
jgi:hypothetical protein